MFSFLAFFLESFLLLLVLDGVSFFLDFFASAEAWDLLLEPPKIETQPVLHDWVSIRCL